MRVPVSSRNLLLGLFTLVAATGCGEEIVARESNEIFLDPPSSLTFARVPVGQTDQRIIKISQGGETDLVVSDIRIAGFEQCDFKKNPQADQDPACEFYISESPMPSWDGNEFEELVMTKGTFRQVVVAYRPTMLTPPPPTQLIVNSNVRDKEELTIDLSVLTAQPRIATTDGETSVSFAGTMGSQNKTIGIRNVGTGTLVVTDVQLRPGSAQFRDDEFRVEPLSGLPWNVDENGVNEVRITYTPLDEHDDRATLVFLSNDAQAPEFAVTLTSVPVTSQLVIAPNPVVFGETNVNETKRVAVSFTNVGLRNLNVLGLTIEQGGATEDYKLDNDQPRSFQLRAGTSKDVDVIYKPLSAEGSDATLVVRTDADNVAQGETGELRVPLRRSVTGLGPLLGIDPPRVDLSDVAPGASETVELTLSNEGDGPLNVTAIRFTGEQDAPEPVSDPEFTVSGGGEPTVIAPGEAHTVEVTFSRGADDRNAHLGTLVVESDAPTSPDLVRFIAEAL